MRKIHWRFLHISTISYVMAWSFIRCVRNHDMQIMEKAFEIAGYDKSVLEEKFGALYNAFQFGAPPHAGMAPGVDRMIMLLRNEENIREGYPIPYERNRTGSHVWRTKRSHRAAAS